MSEEIIFLDYSNKWSRLTSKDTIHNVNWKREEDIIYLFVLYKPFQDYVKYLRFTIKEKEISFRRNILQEARDSTYKRETSGDIRILDMKLDDKECSLLFSNGKFTIEDFSHFTVVLPSSLKDTIHTFIIYLLLIQGSPLIN
jgi:hypothetical protein